MISDNNTSAINTNGNRNNINTAAININGNGTNNNTATISVNEINNKIKLMVYFLFFFNQLLLIPPIYIITMTDIDKYTNVFIVIMYFSTYLYSLLILAIYYFRCNINFMGQSYDDECIKTIYMIGYYLLELLFLATNIIVISKKNMWNDISDNETSFNMFMVIIVFYFVRYLIFIICIFYICIKSHRYFNNMIILNNNASNNVVNSEIIFKKNIISKHFDTCCICLELNNSNSKELANCYHVYHKKCIIEWRKIKNKCPICNKTICNI